MLPYVGIKKEYLEIGAILCNNQPMCWYNIESFSKQYHKIMSVYFHIIQVKLVLTHGGYVLFCVQVIPTVNQQWINSESGCKIQKIKNLTEESETHT